MRRNPLCVWLRVYTLSPDIEGDTYQRVHAVQEGDSSRISKLRRIEEQKNHDRVACLSQSHFWLDKNFKLDVLRGQERGAGCRLSGRARIGISDRRGSSVETDCLALVGCATSHNALWKNLGLLGGLHSWSEGFVTSYMFLYGVDHIKLCEECQNRAFVFSVVHTNYSSQLYRNGTQNERFCVF